MSKSSLNTSDNFLITMIGNTSANGLVLGFSGQSFSPISCRMPIPRYCHALSQSKEIGYVTGGIEDLESNVNAKATLDAQILEGNISKKFYKVNLRKLR
jgi:hypothetical protein